MSLALALYNFSLTDQSPLLQYRPFRDGPLETSWNVSYSANTNLAWEPGDYPDAFVSSYTTQLVGASVELEWTGTAIWFYGLADPAAYDVQLDGSSAIAGAGTNSSDGTLFSLTDLEYGLHSVTLTVVKAPVTVLGATITVGLGETGSILETRNISAVTNNIPPTANPMFSSNGDYWTVNSSYAYDNTTESYPRVVTDMQSASLTFLLNSTVGFAILGSCDYDHGAYNVTLDPPPPDGFVGSMQYNASSHWIALNEIKYLATGMDRTQNYTVTVTNMQKAVFDLAQVMLFDAVPPYVNSVHSQPRSNAC
ncbi:uncharacterized protein LAESUDRAFT_772770 [Laetiporus sulphureus 93-53]|uniref:Uncharacterized protein n=1 Tax=Laetiporus sulphureus 93-53 TaxID=1314785 RepID=A0A165ENX4_9APHY|nr:uncharacterized protein LAESUDRAFT_772770 [Laetiporus sulphureus 93-53]KZT07455.1 hypothetical protein LAESUDRAFT_772770 [Laetiporus sulphureus 93-53]